MGALVIFHVAKISLTLLWRYSPRGRARKKKINSSLPFRGQGALESCLPWASLSSYIVALSFRNVSR